MADRRRRLGILAFVVAFVVFYFVGRWSGGLIEVLVSR